MFKILFVALLVVSASTPAFAQEKLEIKCYPKAEVLSFFKQKSLFVFYQENLKDNQVLIAAEHGHGGFVERGLAYQVRITKKEACVLARGITTNGPRSGNLTFESVHENAGIERTASEWKDIARDNVTNNASIVADLQQKGHSDKNIEATGNSIAALGQNGGATHKGEFSGVLVFEINPNTHRGNLIGGQNGPSGEIFGDKNNFPRG